MFPAADSAQSRSATVQDKSEKEMNAHILLATYVANIPKSDDRLSTKRGIQTPFSCHKCAAGEIRIVQSTKARGKTSAFTKSLENHYDTTENSDILLDITHHSTHPVMPVLSRVPFAKTHSSADIHFLLDFDPEHVLSLKIITLLKECLVIMHGDVERTTSTIKTRAGSYRTIKSIKRAVVQCLHGFPRSISCVSPRHILDSSTAHQNPVFQKTGFSSDLDLTGILEATKMDNVDKGLPFYVQ